MADLQAIRGMVPSRFASRAPALVDAIREAVALARRRAAADAQYAAAARSLRGRPGARGRPQEVADRGSARASPWTCPSCCRSGCWSRWRSARPGAPEDLLRIEGFRRWRVAEFGSALVQVTATAQRTLL